MTDRTKTFAEMAADCAIVAIHATDHDDAMQWIGLSVANALLAIHDALTAADRYAANEAKQREAEPDPLDQDDHRDRLDGYGSRWTRRAHLWCPESCACSEGSWKLDELNGRFGPLTFAPDAAQDATGDDRDERGDADDAQKAILCPECGHGIEWHGKLFGQCSQPGVVCPCRLPVSDVARALIRRAVEQTGGRRG